MSPINSATFGPSGYRPTPHVRRILVVDDDRDTVTSLLAILRDEGYDARGANDGYSALREVDEFDPDVVVVDIAMPRMSGWELAREIRKKRLAQPLLIAIS